MQTNKLVATCAVGVVAIAGLGAALMSGRHDAPDQVVAGAGAASAASGSNEVVTAPPLKAPATIAASASSPARTRSAANGMGAAPVCRECGVVQMVVAVYDQGQPRPNGYQMHIRMDDGTVRTVQQRGALAAGSRVMVEGETVRVLAEQTRAG